MSVAGQLPDDAWDQSFLHAGGTREAERASTAEIAVKSDVLVTITISGSSTLKGSIQAGSRY